MYIVLLHLSGGCTILGNQKCIFPFKHQTKTDDEKMELTEYKKCTEDYGVKPWCATKVDENGIMIESGNCDMKKCKGDKPGDGRF